VIKYKKYRGIERVSTIKDIYITEVRSREFLGKIHPLLI